MELYTDSVGIELYSENKDFFATNKPTDTTGDELDVLIDVEDAVSLQIHYEKDGIEVYNVKPKQVLKVGI